MRRSIGVGVGLKVDDKFVRPIAFAGTLHTLYYLLTNGRIVAGNRRRKRIDIAISTAAIAFRAIAVGAGETTINDHLEYTLPFILLPQPCTVVVIALYSLL